MAGHVRPTMSIMHYCSHQGQNTLITRVQESCSWDTGNDEQTCIIMDYMKNCDKHERHQGGNY